jgi:hypothetical protein
VRQGVPQGHSWLLWEYFVSHLQPRQCCPVNPALLRNHVLPLALILSTMLGIAYRLPLHMPRAMPRIIASSLLEPRIVLPVLRNCLFEKDLVLSVCCKHMTRRREKKQLPAAPWLLTVGRGVLCARFSYRRCKRCEGKVLMTAAAPTVPGRTCLHFQVLCLDSAC